MNYENNHRVVITGGGCVSALGDNWPSVRKTLQSGCNVVRYMDDWDQYEELGPRLAAPILDFQLPPEYGIKKTRPMGRVARLAVRATEFALDSAGLLNNSILQSGDVGISYGSATGSSMAAMEFFDLLDSQSMSRLNGTTYLRMMSHTAAINISVFFGTTGRLQTTSTACTAGSQGIGYAYEAIKNGHQKIMIAGGAEELCPTQAAVFDTVYAASTMNKNPELSPRPFDAKRDGLVLGEGACSLILESYQHAMDRGASVLAEVIGYGTNTDGKHMVRPNQASMEQVMQLALNDAEIDPQAVGYVSAHGTATEYGDIAESKATEQVMGKNTPISSVKSYSGHTLGACGAFEAWTSIMMMNENWFAPTINLTEIDSRCGQLDYIQAQPRKLDTNHIMSNNFAFGGVNTSLIFRRLI